MKKVLAVILCVVLLSACGEKKVNTENKDGQEAEKIFVGIWISYSELADAATGDFKENFTLMCDNALSIGATDLFVHISLIRQCITAESGIAILMAML